MMKSSMSKISEIVNTLHFVVPKEEIGGQH